MPLLCFYVLGLMIFMYVIPKPRNYYFHDIWNSWPEIPVLFLNSGDGIGMYFRENTFFLQRGSSVEDLGFGSYF